MNNDIQYYFNFYFVIMVFCFIVLYFIQKVNEELGIVVGNFFSFGISTVGSIALITLAILHATPILQVQMIVLSIGFLYFSWIDFNNDKLTYLKIKNRNIKIGKQAEQKVSDGIDTVTNTINSDTANKVVTNDESHTFATPLFDENN